MDCKIAGREQTTPETPDLLTYGLKGLSVGQQKFAHQRANSFLQEVMLDPGAPPLLKDLIRSVNAVGVIYLQQLLAAFYQRESILEG
jgi:hypothetical protein